MRRRWRRTGAVSPPVVWQRDGLATLEVASRFGRLTLRRQVLATGVGTAHEAHVTPGNAALPPHGGLVITRGLQELACLLPDTLPFVSAERLLGWQTQAVLETEAVPAVEAVPETEAAAEAKAVLCASTLRTVVRDHGAALRAAVDQALAAGETRSPRGVRAADWERVLTARR